MTTDGQVSRDFDFLLGRWTVQHRRLKERLCGCDEWETFGGTCEVQKMLAGQANVDDNFIDLPNGPYRALTVRSFNSATREWSIWWLDGRAPHAFDPPLVGRFRKGIGTFFGADSLRGTPVSVRFLWTISAAGEPLWEQAFSHDGGVHWEPNWVMVFRQVHASQITAK